MIQIPASYELTNYYATIFFRMRQKVKLVLTYVLSYLLIRYFRATQRDYTDRMKI